MKWIKKGIIYKPNTPFSHAAIPFADFHDEKSLRIYFSSRNEKGQSLPFYIDVDRNKPNIILKKYTSFLSLGELGTFDDNGIMPSCVVSLDDKTKYLYYIGWNPQVTVSYRLSIGLAISNDNGQTYLKYSKGPICDRNIQEPYFNTAPFVIKENDIWRMWYISCTEWLIENNYPEPKYHIKYAESNDGINWIKNGIVCIDYDENSEAIGRPSVLKEGNIYKMCFSYRNICNYRTDRNSSYRLGYAESKDGINWVKKNMLVGINKSLEGWDSDMIEYCHVLNINDNKYMFYNGNSFGKSGFGYEILNEKK